MLERDLILYAQKVDAVDGIRWRIVQGTQAAITAVLEASRSGRDSGVALAVNSLKKSRETLSFLHNVIH
jgi:phage tail protein X